MSKKIKKKDPLIFLGPATVGKGTQAHLMSLFHRGSCLISGSSAQIIAHALRIGNRSEEEIKADMKAGRLVADDQFVNDAFFHSYDNWNHPYFIGDGWGRTLEQVKLLVAGFKERDTCPLWISFEATDDTLEEHRQERVRKGSTRPDDEFETHRKRIADHRGRIGDIERFLVANEENYDVIATDNLAMNQILEKVLDAVPFW